MTMDKEVKAHLQPFAKKIALVFTVADNRKMVWVTKLAEGVGNTYGINKKRGEDLEAYICRVLSQLLCNGVDIDDDKTLGKL